MPEIKAAQKVKAAEALLENFGSLRCVKELAASAKYFLVSAGSDSFYADRFTHLVFLRNLPAGRRVLLRPEKYLPPWSVSKGKNH
jgi:hypothetical protein